MKDGVLTHLLTDGSEEVPLGYVACVTQGIGAVRKQGRSARERRTNIDKMGPIGVGRTAARAVRRTSPPIMGDVRGIHSMRAQNIGKGLVPSAVWIFLREGRVIPPVLHPLEMRMRSTETTPLVLTDLVQSRLKEPI